MSKGLAWIGNSASGASQGCRSQRAEICNATRLAGSRPWRENQGSRSVEVCVSTRRAHEDETNGAAPSRPPARAYVAARKMRLRYAYAGFAKRWLASLLPVLALCFVDLALALTVQSVCTLYSCVFLLFPGVGRAIDRTLRRLLRRK
ncbi:hypothetical protein FVE85_0394 [Porphyridium purpureum]|uniref:Uncharacterized protein n=1 Tax=Porphyridium purpureum TaxID=35688 RepID=A0A5J4YZT2_PORPP|nr:hypothetical protein FVE85_0394 [Porphyridium purpureum]|eukprot:POR3415..scf208_2